jgi:hypothetical protein
MLKKRRGKRIVARLRLLLRHLRYLLLRRSHKQSWLAWARPEVGSRGTADTPYVGSNSVVAASCRPSCDFQDLCLRQVGAGTPSATFEALQVNDKLPQRFDYFEVVTCAILLQYPNTEHNESSLKLLFS